MKHLRTAILHLMCLGPNVLTALVLGFIRLMWGKDTYITRGVVFVELDENSWFAKGPYKGWGGTTFGPHGVMINAGQHQVADHELVHTEQMQAEAVQNFALTVILSAATASTSVLAIGMAWWVLGPLTAIGAANLTAKLRGEKWYRGSHFEEAAYNRGEDHENGH